MIPISEINKFGNRRGVYLFINKKNNKKYIGEALNFRKRMLGYCTSAKHNPNSQRIIKAFVKYGFENFHYFILEEFPNTTSKKTLIERELFWIKFYQSTNPKLGYNVRHRGAIMPDSFKERCRMVAKRGKDNPRYGIPLAEETKRKLSISLSGRTRSESHRKNLSIALTGKKTPQETIEKFKKTRTGVPNLGNSKRVFQIDPHTNEIIREWASANEVSRNIINPKSGKLISQGAISTCITKSKKHICCGYKWRYADE